MLITQIIYSANPVKLYEVETYIECTPSKVKLIYDFNNLDA